MNSTYLEIVEKGCVVCAEETLQEHTLAPYEALIANEASIISAGTELSKVFAFKEGLKFPIRPGYGSVGKIIAKGGALTEYQIGERVFYTGKHASLQYYTAASKTQWDHMFHVDASLDPVEATFACLVNIAMTGPNLAEVKLGDRVAVFGLGMIGLLAAMLFQMQGTKVIGMDTVAERCEFAKSIGLETVVNCPAGEQVKTVMELTNNEGTDIAVDAVGHCAVIASAIHVAKNYSQVLLLGSPRIAFEGNITEPMNAIHMKNLRVIGSLMNCVPLRATEGMHLYAERNFRTAFELIAARKIDARRFISHVISPEQANEAYHGLMYQKERYRCVAIDWRT